MQTQSSFYQQTGQTPMQQPPAQLQQTGFFPTQQQQHSSGLQVHIYQL